MTNAALLAEQIADDPTVMDVSDVIALAAEDYEFYTRTFFPKTCQSATPKYHLDVDSDLCSGARYVGIEIFRDGAKTTLLRLFASKRIAYCISRTIMVVGKGQDHAIKTIRWLKRQVEYNPKWSGAYRLRKGDKWTDEWIEIISDLFNDVDGQPVRINIVAYGLTGQIRGVNIDDYRPDLIVVDDPCDEENTGTPEQRKKIADLFFGALSRCLVPRAENPAALMCLLQTSLHPEDLINMAHRDSTWVTHKISCFDERGNSVWPQRKPTEELLREREGFAERGQLDLWMREMECTLINPQTSLFREEWLNYYDILPEKFAVILSIDPVPPPDDSQMVKGTQDNDYEVICAIGIWRGKKFLLEYRMQRGHRPDWTITNFFEMATKWKPMFIAVETHNYQATLKWILEQEMKKRSQYYIVEGFGKGTGEKVKKMHLISGAFSGLATQRDFYIKPDMVEFISQFSMYPRVGHDDVINAVAIALKKLKDKGDIDAFLEDLEEESKNEREEEWDRGAP